MQLLSNVYDRVKRHNRNAWTPNLTFTSIFYPSSLIGFSITIIGVALLYTSYMLDDMEIEYSGNKCIMSSIFNFSSTSCDEYLRENIGEKCSCEIVFSLPHQFEGKLYVYYKLTNFFQNHRSYVNSYDSHQLAGRSTNVSKYCWPFRFDPKTSLPYAPCGAIANSFFNDTFSLYYTPESGTPLSVPILRTNIAWDTDKSTRFINPPTWEGTKQPPNWKYPANMLDQTDESNNGYQNEALMVWMRTSAFPTFVKLYGRIDHDFNEKFKLGMPGGSYKMIITYNYPTFDFEGKKSIFITNLSWMGSKNYFIGIAYIIAGINFIAITYSCTVVETKISRAFGKLFGFL